MTKQLCYDVTWIVISAIIGFVVIRCYFYYIDKQVHLIVKEPEKANKSVIKILAAGFGAAYVAMLFPNAKETLDFNFYSWQVQLYSITKAIVFLCAIGFGSITGGTFLAKFKGKQDA